MLHRFEVRKRLRRPYGCTSAKSNLPGGDMQFRLSDSIET